MIVLKILLWILLAVIGLIIVVCILPVGGEVSYIDGKVSYKVKLWLLNIMDSDGGGVLGWLKKRKKNAKPKKPKKPKPVKAKKKKKGKEDNLVPEVAAADENTDLSVISDDTGLTEQTETQSAEVSEDKKADEVQDTGKSKEKKKSKKKKKSKETYYEFDDDEDEEEDEKEKKKSIGEILELVNGIWRSAKRPLRSILKGFKFSDVYIDFVIADEDAYKCAMNYAKYSTIIYNALRVFSDLFTVRLKTVDIQPGFGDKKSRWDAALKLHFRVGTMVIAGVWFLVTYIFRIFIPKKLKARKAKKAAQVQE